MKTLFTIAMFCFALASLEASDQKRILNPKFNWVEILNKTVASGNFTFGIDEMDITPRGLPIKFNTCSIGSSDNTFRSSLKIIGELQDGEYIFEYTREGTAYGAPCPSGVFFKARLEDIL